MNVFYRYSMDMDCEVDIKFAIKKILFYVYINLFLKIKKNFLIQDLFGPSLKEILSYYKDNFDICYS